MQPKGIQFPQLWVDGSFWDLSSTLQAFLNSQLLAHHFFSEPYSFQHQLSRHPLLFSIPFCQHPNPVMKTAKHATTLHAHPQHPVYHIPRWHYTPNSISHLSKQTPHTFLSNHTSRFCRHIRSISTFDRSIFQKLLSPIKLQFDAIFFSITTGSTHSPLMYSLCFRYS